jgi:hypothetical protein
VPHEVSDALAACSFFSQVDKSSRKRLIRETDGGLVIEDLAGLRRVTEGPYPRL